MYTWVKIHGLVRPWILTSCQWHREDMGLFGWPLKAFAVPASPVQAIVSLPEKRNHRCCHHRLQLWHLFIMIVWFVQHSQMCHKQNKLYRIFVSIFNCQKIPSSVGKLCLAHSQKWCHGKHGFLYDLGDMGVLKPVVQVCCCTGFSSVAFGLSLGN